MVNQFSGYLEKEEVRAIINAVPNVSPHAERDALLFEVLWESGARVSEALALMPKMVGLTDLTLPNLKQSKIVKIDDKTMKVKDPMAIKEVEVSANLCSVLKEYCSKNDIGPDDYIFKSDIKPNCHLTPWYVWNTMNKASEFAGVYRLGKRNPRTGGRRKGAYPHLFRHSNAMLLLEETRDIDIVSQQLGHSSIKTTQIYAYTKKPKIKREVAKIDWE